MWVCFLAEVFLVQSNFRCVFRSTATVLAHSSITNNILFHPYQSLPSQISPQLTFQTLPYICITQGQMTLFSMFKQPIGFYNLNKIKMGGSNGKIRLAIIDQNQKQQDFEPVTKQDILKSTYYKTYEEFLENQSLKKLSYIIIREKDSSQKEGQKAENSMVRKKIENLKEIEAELSQLARKKNVTVREKLIAYIKKYSLEKLVIYVFVKNVLNYQVPDYELPYLTLVSDSLQAIIDHVKTNPKREEPAIFKFKRLVKDLYRRSTARVLDITQIKDSKIQDGSDNEWKQLFAKEKIPVEFSSDIESFQQSLISNYNDYIIVSNPKTLTYILDAKKQFQLESKIIYLGDESQVADKKQTIWMVQNGSSQIDKAVVVQTIKRCTDMITDQTSTRPKLTVIFTTQHYSKQEKEFVKDKTIQHLKKVNKQKDWKWIEDMKIIVTSNYAHFQDAVKKFVYTYLITFDCTIPQTEDLKAWLKKNHLGNRIYLYNLELKPDANLESQTKEERLKQLTKNVELMVKKANFKIKFQIGPLQSIALFEMGEREGRYFSTKLGFITTSLTQADFKEKYCIENREKIIDNYYIVSSVQAYFERLKQLIDSEKDNSNSYFKDLKVIIYDKREAIKQRWDSITKAQNIAFVHYSLTKIEQFLDTVFVPSLKLTIFVKKALPQYVQSLKNVEESRCRSLKLKGIIVTKNQLLKEVFSQDILTSSQFQLSFKHYSITNRNAEQSIDYLYTFIAKFANLWRVGYDIIKANQDKAQVINTLREDLKGCLYKCKCYSLLDVSQDEFDYFYIKKLDLCKTFLDLQIATIYMTTLPYGFSKILEQIFSRPKQSSMIPKVFGAFIVILLTAFCSVEDQVMSNKSLVAYIDDDDLASKISSVNIGDKLFNTSFIPTGKNEDQATNMSNHCIFFQFEDIPMLSDTFIKNYLYIQRFSFYKGSSEYLIAPFTQLVVRNKILTSTGKYHIFLHAVNNQQKNFARYVFKANSIDDKQLFNTIKDEIYTMHDDEDLISMTQEAKSLYKKAEIISLFEEKKEMIESINDSLQYKNFLNAMHKQRHLSALSHLGLKYKKEKKTTEIQAQYFKNMLGVEKSLVYFKLNEFDIAIKQLQKVQAFLENEESDSWVLRNVRNFKEAMNNISKKRHKLFNRSAKTKQWKIYAEKQVVRQVNRQGKKQYKAVVVMEQKQFSWDAEYLSKRQDFYIVNKNNPNTAYLPFKIKQNYGEHTNSFDNDMVYEKRKLTELIEEEKTVQGYFKYHIQNRPKKGDSLQKQASKQQKKQKSHKLIEKNSIRDERAARKKLNAKPTIIFEAKEEPNIFQEFAKEVKENVAARQNIQRIDLDQKANKQPTTWKLKQIKGFKSLQQLFGASQTVNWQSFYIGDKFVLTKKGKHFKGKMTNNMMQ